MLTYLISTIPSFVTSLFEFIELHPSAISMDWKSFLLYVRVSLLNSSFIPSKLFVSLSSLSLSQLVDKSSFVLIWSIAICVPEKRLFGVSGDSFISLSNISLLFSDEHDCFESTLDRSLFEEAPFEIEHVDDSSLHISDWRNAMPLFGTSFAFILTNYTLLKLSLN